MSSTRTARSDGTARHVAGAAGTHGTCPAGFPKAMPMLQHPATTTSSAEPQRALLRADRRGQPCDRRRGGELSASSCVRPGRQRRNLVNEPRRGGAEGPGRPGRSAGPPGSEGPCALHDAHSNRNTAGYRLGRSLSWITSTPDRVQAAALRPRPAALPQAPILRLAVVSETRKLRETGSYRRPGLMVDVGIG
jgi:hypothetical protein